MVPSERALVSSYMPSIVTSPISYAFRRLLPILCFSAPLFSHTTSSLPKFPYIPLVDGLWATKSDEVELIVRAVSFQDFQLMLS